MADFPRNVPRDRLLRQIDFKQLAKHAVMRQTLAANLSAQAREHDMAVGSIPHFQNDAGHAAIDIGVKEFMCVGANPPFDHPHVFLDMGADDEKVCPYCSTLYRYDPSLKASETRPENCLYLDRAA
jgi:uncharacterized Zn-finger protein